MTYREQDPGALRARIAELEREVAKMRKPRRRLTKRGWLVVVHFAALAISFGADDVMVCIAASAWSLVAMAWQAMRAEFEGEDLTEPVR